MMEMQLKGHCARHTQHCSDSLSDSDESADDKALKECQAQLKLALKTERRLARMEGDTEAARAINDVLDGWGSETSPSPRRRASTSGSASGVDSIAVDGFRTLQGDLTGRSRNVSSAQHLSEEDLPNASISDDPRLDARLSGGSVVMAGPRTSTKPEELGQPNSNWSQRRRDIAPLLSMLSRTVPHEDEEEKTKKMKHAERHNRQPRQTKYEKEINVLIDDFCSSLNDKMRKTGEGCEESNKILMPSRANMSDAVVDGLLNYLLHCQAMQDFEPFVREGEHVTGEEKRSRLAGMINMLNDDEGMP